jgi:hypothetical protein
MEREMNILRSGLAAALFGAILFGPLPAQAQSYLLPGTPEKGLWLEVSHPEVEAFEVTVPSTAWYASARYPVAQRFWGVAEIPFAYGKVDGPAIPELEGGTVLGNPYVGMEYAASDRIRVEAGVRLPLTTADDLSFGDVVGFLADPLRGEAFMQDVVPLSSAVTFSHSLDSGVKLQARSGVTSMIWRGDDELGETVTALDYGILAHYPRGLARFGGGLTGRWDVSAEEDGFSENSLHQLGLNGDYQFGRFRPGLNLRVPLDKEYRDLVSASVGVYLQVSLP